MTYPPLLPMLHPRYWPAWAALGLLRLIICLPERWQLKAGRGLGNVLFSMGGKLRRITETNLRLCFPDSTAEARQTLARRNFQSLGIGLIESARAFWLTDAELLSACTLHGLEHATAAFARQRHSGGQPAFQLS